MYLYIYPYGKPIRRGKYSGNGKDNKRHHEMAEWLIADNAVSCFSFGIFWSGSLKKSGGKHG